MKKILYSIAFILIFLTLHSIYAQENENYDEPIMYLGGYGNYNYNMHIADFNELPGYPSCCPEYEGGTGHGFSVGALLEFPLKPSLNLGGRLGFSMMNGMLQENEHIGNTLVRVINSPNETEIRDVNVDHIIDASIFAVDLEPYINFIFFDKLYSTVGLRFSYLVNSRFDTREEITEPENVVFINGSRLRNDYNDQDIPDINPFQIGASIGLGYELEIGRDSYLSPEVRYYLPFMNISSVEWKVASLQIGASVKFPVYPTKDLPIIRDTVYRRDTIMVADYGFSSEQVILKNREEDLVVRELENNILHRTILTENYEKLVPKEAKVFTSLETYGIGEDGQRQQNPTIVIEEIETEERFPVLPYVFFRENSAELVRTDMNLLSEKDTEYFDQQDLSWNAMSIYANMLNIIAERMQENPSAKITITGTNKDIGPEENNLDLSRRRAEAVKEYFTDVWGIDANRIDIRSRNLPSSPGNNDHPDGQIENQRAEIDSDNWEVLRPLTLKEIARTSNPPVIEVRPKSKSDVGIVSWQLNVEQEGRVLRKYQGSEVPQKIKWNVEEEPMPRLEEPISVQFAAKDILGNKSVAESDIELQQLTIKKKREVIQDDKRIEKFSLILFDYDKARLTPRQKRLLSKIKDKIKEDTEVTITGYADRTGDPEYNMQLSKRRIDEVQGVLQVPKENLKTKPVGSSVLLYDNDTPQGRSYSRTVQITLETPVEN